jgi:fructose-bisphosphate aldolase class II
LDISILDRNTDYQVPFDLKISTICFFFPNFEAYQINIKMSLKGYKGVIYGAAVQELFEQAKKHQFALPAVNVTGTNTINAVMETAKAVNSPVMIQLSNGGAQFYAGKTLNNDNLNACILGAVSAAKHVHLLAEHYGVAVVLHTDHAAKKLLPWIDGLLTHGEQFFAETGKPLFSSHMLDLSEEPIEENMEICVEYFKRMSKMGMTIEIELGVTGGEEDGVDNSGCRQF